MVFSLITIAQHWLRNLKHELRFKLNIWTVSALFIGIIIFLPIAGVIWHISSPAENWEHLRDTVLGRYLKGSSILLLGTVVLSILMGVSSAWLVACCEFPGRKFFEGALILPLAIPTYIAAYAYFDLVEYLNPLLIWVRLNISPSAMMMLNDVIVYLVTIMVLTSVLYPYVYLVTRATFAIQSSQCIEVARTLGHGVGSTFWRVALPLARPAIVGGVSLVIMETLNDYGAVKHFGVSTFTTGIFRTWLSLNDMPGALRLAACLMAFILLIMLLEKWMRFGAKFHINSQTTRPFKPYLLTNIKAFSALLCCLFPLIIGFAMPVSRLAYWAIMTVDKVSLLSLLKLTFNSIGIASAASLVTVTIALILAFTSRYFRSQNVAVINRFAILGYAVPGAVIAMGILLVAGQFTKVTGIIFTGSLIVLVFAYVVRFLAVAWQPIDSGMERNCDMLNEASRSLGSSVSRSLLQVNLPLVYNSIAVGALFVFVDTMKELPLTLILRPFNFETLSTRTFDLASQAQIPESSIPALCIIAVSLLPVIWLNRQMSNLKK